MLRLYKNTGLLRHFAPRNDTAYLTRLALVGDTAEFP